MKRRKGRVAIVLLIIFCMAFPMGFATAAPTENYHLSGWDKEQQKWTPGNLSGYAEGDWVPFRIEMKNYAGQATEVCFQHDYEKLGTYGFSESRNFCISDSDGNLLFSPNDGVFSMTGPVYRPDNGGVMIMEYCFNLINITQLTGNTFYLCWETQLAGPNGASAWSGASLHTTTSVTGAQTVPISVQKITPLLTAKLDLTKTASTDIANPGDTVTYTFTVTNTGDYAYSDVVLTDPLFGGSWSYSFGSLAVGTSKTQTVPYTIPIGTPPGPFVNHAFATGTYTGGVITATDSETLVIQTVVSDNPSINIHKTVTPVEAEPGDTVSYSIHVTNTGNIDLQNVIVSDSLFGDSWSYVIDLLHAGEVVMIDEPYMVPADAVTGVLQNTVSVTGSYQGGQVSDTADAALNIVSDDPPVLTAGVELTKTTEDLTVNPGDTVTYHFSVKNTGTYSLKDILVTDALLGSGWSYPISELAPGASVSFDYDYLVSADHAPGIIENNAMVTAHYESGTITDETSETVAVVATPSDGQASMHVDKTADVTSAMPEETITYTIHVTNDGDVDLTNVVLTDHLMGDSWSYAIGTLHVGETKEYQYTYTIPEGTLAGELINTAVVSGRGGDETITQSDEVTVFVDAPPPEITNLILTSICSENPDLTRRWKITNINHTDISYEWVLLESGATGTGVVTGDTDVYLETQTVAGVNTLKITYLDGRVETRVSSGLRCPENELELITIHSMCASGPEGDQVEWQINNPNDFDVEVAWTSENSAGTMTLAPGINILYTARLHNSPNTLTLTIDGEVYAIETAACFEDIGLDAVCSEVPEESLRWRLINNNDYPVEVSWVLIGSSPVQTGTVTALPGSTYFYTDTIPGDNVVAIFVDDILQRNGAVKSLKVACPPGETPNGGEDETAVLGEQEVDIGDTVDPSLPDGTITIEDVLGDSDDLPQTGGIYLWYLYLPGLALVAGGTVMFVYHKKRERFE